MDPNKRIIRIFRTTIVIILEIKYINKYIEKIYHFIGYLFENPFYFFRE